MPGESTSVGTPGHRRRAPGLARIRTSPGDSFCPRIRQNLRATPAQSGAARKPRPMRGWCGSSALLLPEPFRSEVFSKNTAQGAPPRLFSPQNRAAPRGWEPVAAFAPPYYPGCFPPRHLAAPLEGKLPRMPRTLPHPLRPQPPHPGTAAPFVGERGQGIPRPVESMPSPPR